jgi:hypothetical protein
MAQDFPNRRAAHGKRRHQFAFGRQPVTRLQAGSLDVVGKGGYHLLRPINGRQGQERRSILLRHPVLQDQIGLTSEQYGSRSAAWSRGKIYDMPAAAAVPAASQPGEFGTATMVSVTNSYAGDGSYPTSYYAASRNIIRSPIKLEGKIETDICVVGAGYTGLSTAIHLAEKGYKVTFVEGAQVGWGASGRNGGQIVNGLNASLSTIQRRYGEDAARFIGGLVQEGGRIIRRLVSQYRIDCDLKPGNIYAAYTGAHMKELEAKQALWRKYGMDDHQLLDREALRSSSIPRSIAAACSTPPAATCTRSIWCSARPAPSRASAASSMNCRR